MLREAWANYQTISDERARAKIRTILSASILPFALQLGQGFWNHTGLSEVQWAGRPPLSFLLSSSTTRMVAVESIAVEIAVLSLRVALIESSGIHTDSKADSSYTWWKECASGPTTMTYAHQMTYPNMTRLCRDAGRSTRNNRLTTAACITGPTIFCYWLTAYTGENI